MFLWLSVICYKSDGIFQYGHGDLAKSWGTLRVNCCAFQYFSLWLWLSEWACSWLLMSVSSVVAVFMKYCPCMGMLLGVHCWGDLPDILSSLSSHCTCRWNLQQANLQISWNDLSKWQATRNLVSLMACQCNMILIFTTSSCHFCVHLPILSYSKFSSAVSKIVMHLFKEEHAWIFAKFLYILNA